MSEKDAQLRVGVARVGVSTGEPETEVAHRGRGPKYAGPAEEVVRKVVVPPTEEADPFTARLRTAVIDRWVKDEEGNRPTQTAIASDLNMSSKALYRRMQDRHLPRWHDFVTLTLAEVSETVRK